MDFLKSQNAIPYMFCALTERFNDYKSRICPDEIKPYEDELSTIAANALNCLSDPRMGYNKSTEHCVHVHVPLVLGKTSYHLTGFAASGGYLFGDRAQNDSYSRSLFYFGAFLFEDARGGIVPCSLSIYANLINSINLLNQMQFLSKEDILPTEFEFTGANMAIDKNVENHNVFPVKDNEAVWNYSFVMSPSYPVYINVIDNLRVDILLEKCPSAKFTCFSTTQRSRIETVSNSERRLISSIQGDSDKSQKRNATRIHEENKISQKDCNSFAPASNTHRKSDSGKQTASTQMDLPSKSSFAIDNNRFEQWSEKNQSEIEQILKLLMKYPNLKDALLRTALLMEDIENEHIVKSLFEEYFEQCEKEMFFTTEKYLDGKITHCFNDLQNKYKTEISKKRRRR